MELTHLSFPSSTSRFQIAKFGDMSKFVRLINHDVIKRLAKSEVWAEGGLFVLEHGATHSFESHPWFLEHRAYGSVNFSLFRKPGGEETEE